MRHGNEDTFKEMLRIKRSVQAQYNTKVCQCLIFLIYILLYTIRVLCRSISCQLRSCCHFKVQNERHSSEKTMLEKAGPQNLAMHSWV